MTLAFQPGVSKVIKHCNVQYCYQDVAADGNVQMDMQMVSDWKEKRDNHNFQGFNALMSGGHRWWWLGHSHQWAIKGKFQAKRVEVTTSNPSSFHLSNPFKSFHFPNRYHVPPLFHLHAIHWKSGYVVPEIVVRGLFSTSIQRFSRCQLPSLWSISL